MVLEGDNLETQPSQVLLVYSTFFSHAAFAAISFLDILDRNGGNLEMTLAECLVLLASSWLLADLGSGVLHFAVDNYGNGRTVSHISSASLRHHTSQRLCFVSPYWEGSLLPFKVTIRHRGQ